jgi:cyclopropane fatty-acyl-phospholipid synthase-like methyltransferase
MSKDTEKSMSESMEAHPDILPYLPQLLTDMWALGSSPEKIVEIVRSLKLPEDTTRVLDLGCGKGAVCIQLAKHFGFKVVGVDACEPFLAEARIKAREHSVESQCEFIRTDIRDFVKTAKGYDLAVLASLGGIFGGYKQTVNILRATVRSGGYLIIDDGFLKGERPLTRSGYTHYLSYNRAIENLTAQGDKLIREVILTNEENSAIDREYINKLKERSSPLLKKNPELKQLIDEYIKNQEMECDVIENNLTGAIWLIQKR